MTSLPHGSQSPMLEGMGEASMGGAGVSARTCCWAVWWALGATGSLEASEVILHLLGILEDPTSNVEIV